MTDRTDSTDAVVIERLLDAPPDVVWRMWTDGERFATWYGPTGASIPVADLDATVGGRRRVCMEVATPDGPMRMWFGGEHLVVEAPTLLVYTEQVTGEDGIPVDDAPATEVRVELTAEAEGRTRMVMTHTGIAAGSPGDAGWQMALDTLADHLTG